MRRKVPYRFAFFSALFCLPVLGGPHLSGSGVPSVTQENSSSSYSENPNWCHGILSENERAAIRSELTAIYSRYKDNPEELQSKISNIVSNYDGSGGRGRGAAIAHEINDTFSKIGKVSQFNDALSALSNGTEPTDTKVFQLTKALKPDFDKLTAFGLKYDSQNGRWDFSALANRALDLNSMDPSLKEAFKNLISPDIAEKFFDPNRKEALRMEGHVVRPPGMGFRVVSQEDQDAAVQRALDRFAEAKEAFLAASREANTYSNGMTGRILQSVGIERGHEGETDPEIARRSALSNMERQLGFLRDSLGVKQEVLDPVYASVQGALSQDSSGLQALDRELTQKINTFKTTLKVLGVVAVSVLTAGVMAPAALATVIGAASFTSASVIGTAMAVPLVLQGAVGLANVGIEGFRNGTSASCAAMDELYHRGPGAVAGSAMAAAFVAAPVALAPAGAAVGVAQVGVGGYFTIQGIRGTLQGAAGLRAVLDEAEAAEARGDFETAARLRTDAMKIGTELVANGVMQAQGLRQLYSGYRSFQNQRQQQQQQQPPQQQSVTPTSEHVGALQLPTRFTQQIAETILRNSHGRVITHSNGRQQTLHPLDHGRPPGQRGSTAHLIANVRTSNGNGKMRQVNFRHTRDMNNSVAGALNSRREGINKLKPGEEMSFTHELSSPVQGYQVGSGSALPRPGYPTTKIQAVEISVRNEGGELLVVHLSPKSSN